jgi:two-component system NtrC family response regulator
MKSKLLLVDDDEEIRSQMRWALAQEYDVIEAEDRASALQAFQRASPPVVLLDLGLPPSVGTPNEGLAVLSEMVGANRMTKVIIVTGQSDKANALRAIGQGAYDFLCKPVEMEELKIILRRAFHVALLEREYQEIQQRWSGDGFEGMLGTSPKMQEVFAAIRKVATTEVPVLILGESGTGKEMTALAIHRQSRRKEGPFVAINCTAIPETLLESELFGHEKGSFTGAHAQRKGRIEMATAGTLFLDEIGELPLSLQVKLLRFLQEQRIERVGGREGIHIDARVLAATNVDIEQALKDGRFREDLYYRLGVVVASLPPLRERDGDIPLLARAFLQRYASENKKGMMAFTPQALRAIEHHSWPGNIRELENRVKRAVIMADSKKVTPADLELTSPYSRYEGKGLKESREALERDMVQRALARNKGNLTSAASELGISRPSLYDLMDKLGIERERDKA